MITIRFFLESLRDSAADVETQAITGIEATGHANFAKLGDDVVCAAVSVLLQTLWLGLTDIAKITLDGGWKSGDLHLSWSLLDAQRPDVAALSRTTERALEALAAQYPRHLRVLA